MFSPQKLKNGEITNSYLKKYVYINIMYPRTFFCFIGEKKSRAVFFFF